MASPQTSNGFTRLANELLEALMRVPSIGSEAFQVLMYVIRRTYGFNRTAAKISYGDISRATGLERRNAVRGMARLVEKKIVFRIRETTAINKNYDAWVVSKRTLAPGVQSDTGSVSDRTRPPVSDRTRLHKDRKETLKTRGDVSTGMTSIGDVLDNGGGYGERI